MHIPVVQRKDCRCKEDSDMLFATALICPHSPEFCQQEMNRICWWFFEFI
ncbi:hypothetical protein SLEP1_g38124 [Rubroshorea leprosula]|uniref:Uncharacterized protein n=1 Tax=Rubroshorea leprosula TaxID=152421 RepID=A0AAV5KX75_9ROSI|nr:hypothetical protein SLEP1_g38124 [Rubroshorea leprosula]